MRLLKYSPFVAAMLTAAVPVFAQTAPYKLDVGDFSELKVIDGINVEYNCSNDSAGWAFFESSPEMAQILMFSNDKNRLQIQVASNGEKISGLPTIKVYSTTLQKVENSGDSTLRVASCLPVSEFKATVIGNGEIIVHDLRTHKVDAAIRTGNGHLVVTGATQRANLKNVGTGTLEASGLQAAEVKCSILGTGPIDCNASASLTIVGAGSGKVYYGGTPAKITNRAIGVKAFSMDNKQEIQ